MNKKNIIFFINKKSGSFKNYIFTDFVNYMNNCLYKINIVDISFDMVSDVQVIKEVHLDKKDTILTAIGGDGTIAYAAQILSYVKKKYSIEAILSIIPFGTSNVLSKDLLMPKFKKKTFHTIKSIFYLTK